MYLLGSVCFIKAQHSLCYKAFRKFRDCSWLWSCGFVIVRNNLFILSWRPPAVRPRSVTKQTNAVLLWILYTPPCIALPTYCVSTFSPHTGAARGDTDAGVLDKRGLSSFNVSVITSCQSDTPRLLPSAAAAFIALQAVYKAHSHPDKAE